MQIFVSRRKRASIQRPSRFCGGVSCRPSGKKSSGRLARISKARASPFPFSRNTISSPRRKISTSLPFSRNSFGSRTAWLLPERKTRAVAIWVCSVILQNRLGTGRAEWAAGPSLPCEHPARGPLRQARVYLIIYIYTYQRNDADAHQYRDR